MGSLVGNLVTGKKKKKLNNAIAQESQNQVALSLENVGFEKEQRAVAQVQANLQMQQERISAMREARIRRAEIIASGVNAGAANSTPLANAADSIYSQFVGSLGLQNVFSGYSKELSRLNDEIANNQSEIISSQGRQANYQAKLQKQQAKAELIGSAVDAGISAVTMFAGGAGIGSMFRTATTGFASALGSTAATAARGASSLWAGSSPGYTSIFSRNKIGF